VGSNQHFPQGWGKWKVNGGEKAGMSITSQTAKSVQRKKPKRQGLKLPSEVFLPLLTHGSEDPEYTVVGP